MPVQESSLLYIQAGNGRATRPLSHTLHIQNVEKKLSRSLHPQGMNIESPFLVTAITCDKRHWKHNKIKIASIMQSDEWPTISTF